MLFLKKSKMKPAFNAEFNHWSHQKMLYLSLNSTVMNLVSTAHASLVEKS